MSDKATTNREALIKVTSLVKPALSTQSYIPALKHIRFADGWATTYNDVAGIAVRCDIEVERCLPGETLIRALASFGAENLMVQEGKDSSVVLVSGRSKLKLPTMELKDFPFELPDEDAAEIVIDANIMKGIERCLLSVGNDPTHPATMGVTLDIDDNGHAVLYSTDNTTVSRYQTKTKIKLPADAPVIMPTFFCEQLVALTRAFADKEVEMQLLDGALLVFWGTSAKLFTKTVNDLVPLDFPRLMSKYCKMESLKKQLSIIPDSFDAALGRALLVLSGEVDKSTKITVTDGFLKLSSTSSMGDSDDSMKFETNADDSIGDSFFVDPSLILRASKVCGLVGFMPKVVIMSDPDVTFVHLVAHCSK